MIIMEPHWENIPDEVFLRETKLINYSIDSVVTLPYLDNKWCSKLNDGILTKNNHLHIIMIE